MNALVRTRERAGLSDGRFLRRLAGLIAGAALLAPSVALAASPTGPLPIGHRPGDPSPILSRSSLQAESAPYAKGQFIIKFRDSLSEPADLLFRQGRRFQSATSDGGPTLDQLNAKYRVKAIRPLLGQLSRDPSLASRRQTLSRQLEAAKLRHAQRTQRAKKNAGIPDFSHVYLINASPDADIRVLCADYVNDPHVAACQPNYTARAHFVPNDPYYGSSGSWGQAYGDLWGLHLIQMAPAWDLSAGQGAVVAVVDTGADAAHADLAANVWVNPGEVPNGVDDDGNGFIDDTGGWDFINGDNDPMDDNGHGTHVSGTIAAVGDNGIGIIGVAYRATVMPVKGLDLFGFGGFAELANALIYAAMNGADVINSSWGCFGCVDDFMLNDAIQLAHGLGVVTVFSAGNENGDVRYAYPANREDVLTVAATGADDSRASFSNWGYLVDVAAPGGGPDDDPSFSIYEPFRNILSLHTAAGLNDPNLIVGGEYLRQAGTSMAAPHVAGIAALLLARNPALTRDEVMAIIKHTAQDQVGDPAVDAPGYDPFYGWGRLSGGAVSQAFTPPPDPPLLAVKPEQLTVAVPQAACAGNVAFLDIFNIGGGALNWSAAAPPWLTVDPPSGTTPSYPLLGIDAGQSQQGVLSIQSAEAANSPQDIAVAVQVTPGITMLNCNVVISQAGLNQQWQPFYQPSPPGVPDGAGGAIYVWTDTRNFNPDLFVQRVGSSGTPLWAADGVQLTSAPGAEINPAIIPDGAGGAIVTWEEGPDSFEIVERNIKAQRISASGQLLWGADGLSVSAAPDGQVLPVIVPDGAGGAIIAWEDYRNGSSDLYAQRVSGAGVPLWAVDGVPLTQAADYQFSLSMIPDGHGGAIAAWTDRRSAFFTIYAQRLDGNGQALWEADGVRVGTQDASDFANLVPDGSGGAIILWKDFQAVTGFFLDHFDLYGARVDAAGQPLWGAGVPIVTGLTVAGGKFEPNFLPGQATMIPDGAGGAIVTWMDDREGDWDVFAQRVDGNGAPVWAANGVPVVTAPGSQMMPALISDGANGAIVAWFDQRTANGDLYVQYLDAAGQPVFPADGVWVQGAAGNQLYPHLVPLAGTTFALTWDDYRNCPDFFCGGTGVDMLGQVIQFERAAVGAPDLIVTHLLPKSFFVRAGGELPVFNTAKNDGTLASDASLMAFRLSVNAVYGDADDRLLKPARIIRALAPGASHSAVTELQIPALTPPGKYFVCAKADATNAVEELDEDNNTRCTSSPVTVLPRRR
ncbi:MAG: S8 family serine peptidase [Nitrospirota bacterium]